MQNIRVLAVDDEKDFLEMLTEYLEPRGYAIDTATESRQILEMLNNKVYDVALLDLKMEGVTGDEIMRYIESIHVPTKVVFVTAYHDSGRTQNRLLKMGAYAYLEKPISSLKALEDLIKEAAKTLEEETKK